MTLLPLAGWAQTTDISSDPKVSMSTGNTVFGGVTAPAIQVLYDGYKLTKDDGIGDPEDYSWDGKYYTTSACTVEAGDIDELEVGTYWVKVVGVGVYTGTRTASFEVTKKPIVVALLAPLAKVYGAADPALTDANINWTGAAFEGTDDKSVFSGSLTYTYDNGNVGNHDIDITGYTAKNYTLTVTGGINITAKPIAAGMITAVTLSETYKAEAFTEFAVNIKDGATPLVAGTDFLLGVYSDEAMTTPAAPTYVGTYYLGISTKAGANYSVATEPTAVGTFEITKAGLTVRALNQTKVYTGNKTLPDATTIDVAYQLIGVQGADVFGAPTLTVDGNANVGSKTITPSYAVENANYDYNYVEGTLTITKRGLTITANDAKKVYKKAESTVTKMDGSAKDATVGYAGVTFVSAPAYEGDLWDINVNAAADIALMKNAYATTNATTKQYGTLRVTRTGSDENKGDYAGVLTITRNESGTIWNNYDVTLVPGAFHITGGKLYITALPQSKNYGQADPSWTAVEEKAGNENPNYRVDGISAPDVVTGVTLTCTHEEAVGTYDINIAASGVPTGYEEIVFVPATFTINTRPLAVTAKVQTLKIGDDIANLDQNAYEITSTNANEGLKEGDKASDVFTLSIDETLTGVLPLTAEGVFKKAIIKANGAKAANYNVTFTKGTLIVIDPASTIALNRPAKAAYTADPTLDDAAAVIAAAAAAKYTQAQADAYNATLEGAVAPGDETGSFYDAAGAVAYNAALDGAVAEGDDTGDDYDAAGAAAYNAALSGAVAEGDDTGDDYDAAGAAAYNATLDGAVAEGDDTGDDYDADGAAAYNAALGGAVAEGDAAPDDFNTQTGHDPANASSLTGDEAAEYNATLDGAVAAGDNILYTAATAADHNAGLAGAVAAGDNILYTAATAAAFNAALGGAVNAGDPILYTAETAAAHNATLDGKKTTADQRPFAVTFGDFAMKAEKWYPIVLPFATSVKEVSEAFGYAIVNILKKDNADATKIAFKLHMGNIPANEPFVVKVYEDINMNEVFFGDPADPTDRKAIVNSAAPEVADASGVKFIGSYSAKTTGFAANEAFFSVSAEKNDYYWGSDKNKTYMAPLSAYFQIPAGSPARTIVFEEPDGTVTAIEAVTTVNDSKINEGMYNLNGVKLNSVPTQKGIYILNGKKVVIK